MAPNGPEKWGCRTHVEWEFETYTVKRDYETKKTAGALEPPEPPKLAPMQIVYTLVLKIMLEKTFEVGLQFIMKDWSSVWFLDFWKFSLIGSMFSFGMQTPSLE